MELLAIILDGKVGNLQTRYLGMPLGEKSNSQGIWDTTFEKCEKKFTTGKSQYLFFRGRLTLINVVLDAFPTYMLSLFSIPPKVIQRLDKVRRSFLWQGNKEKRDFPLVKWKEITRSKRQQVLGIRNLMHHKRALKLKWL